MKGVEDGGLMKGGWESWGRRGRRGEVQGEGGSRERFWKRGRGFSKRVFRSKKHKIQKKSSRDESKFSKKHAR